ncbi:MAG: hypothetical protein QXK90_02835 [Candidatus Parvarchaeota archaeon]
MNLLPLFYTILSFIAGIGTIIAIAVFEYFRLKIVRVFSVDHFNRIFGAMMFNNARRFTAAFMSLSIGAVLLAVGFVLNFLLSFYVQTPIVWEVFSGITLVLVMLFFIFLTGVYNLKLWKLYLK